MSAPALLEGFGVEIEWMTVDAADGSVRPLAPLLLTEGGELRDERVRGPMGWSNELATHVIEAKTLAVPAGLAGLADAFAAEVRAMDALLAPSRARLLGGGAHPLMDPAREASLWEGGQSAIYRAYDRIFRCDGHGWVNLQSVHLNLAFDGDEELRRLHRAVRLVLPLLPALAAASPFLEGRRQPYLDARLDTYRRNQRRIPAIAGLVVPEPIVDAADYRRRILEPMYRAIAPHDREGILQEEWLNSRGAIVRFDRSALEIRVIDCQESPRQDLAICAAAVAIVRALVEEALPGGLDDEGSTERLAALLWRVAREAEAAIVDDSALLRALGLNRLGAPTAGRLWRELLQRFPPEAEHAPALEVILAQGSLARRMVRRVGSEPTREALVALMGEMATCLAAGAPFEPGPP